MEAIGIIGVKRDYIGLLSGLQGIYWGCLYRDNGKKMETTLGLVVVLRNVKFRVSNSDAPLRTRG